LEQIEVLKDVKDIILTVEIQPSASGAVKASDAKGEIQGVWLLKIANVSSLHPPPFPFNAITLLMVPHHGRLGKRPRTKRWSAPPSARSSTCPSRCRRRMETYLPYMYSNYASRDQDPLASYGVENLQKPKDIAKKYDVDAVFQIFRMEVSRRRKQARKISRSWRFGKEIKDIWN
jgi:hypothetical protein